MTIPSHRRRLVIVYAALTGLVDLLVLLPGNPDFSSGWGFVGAVVIQTLLVWRLWHGSTLAWVVAFLMAALTPVSVYLMAAPVQAGTTLLVVLSVAQAGALVALPVAKLVWSNGKTPTTSPLIDLGGPDRYGLGPIRPGLGKNFRRL